MTTATTPKKPMKPITFKNYEPMLRKLAFKFTQRLAAARIMGIDGDDVMGYLSEWYVRASQTYRPESGCVFSTYLMSTCYNNFNHLAERLMKEQYGVERETDVDRRSTTTAGLGYCSVEVMSNDDGEVLNLYDVTEDDTFAAPEEVLASKRQVQSLLSDPTLSPFTRTFVMALVNPELDLADQVVQAVIAHAPTIRAEVQQRWGVNVTVTNIRNAFA